MTKTKERKQTNIILKVDKEIWERFFGLSKFLDVDRSELLNEAMEDKMDKEGTNKKRKP